MATMHRDAARFNDLTAECTDDHESPVTPVVTETPCKDDLDTAIFNLEHGNAGCGGGEAPPDGPDDGGPDGESPGDGITRDQLLASLGLLIPFAVNCLINRKFAREDAEDAANDVALCVVQRSWEAGFWWASISHFRNWFLRASFHRACRVVSAGGPLAHAAPLPSEDVAQVDPWADYDRELTRDLLLQCVRGLSPLDRFVIVRHYLEGMTFERIGEELDCHPGTACRYCAVAIRNLRGVLDHHGGSLLD